MPAYNIQVIQNPNNVELLYLGNNEDNKKSVLYPEGNTTGSIGLLINGMGNGYYTSLGATNAESYYSQHLGEELTFIVVNK